MMRLATCGCRSVWCWLDSLGHAIPLETIRPHPPLGLRTARGQHHARRELGARPATPCPCACLCATLTNWTHPRRWCGCCPLGCTNCAHGPREHR